MAEENNEQVQEKEQDQPEVVETEFVETDQQDSDQHGEKEETVEELQQRIQQLEKEKEEFQSRMLRVQADYDNFRRRTKEEKAAAAKYKALGFAEKLLPALDNFDRALNTKAEGEEAKSLLQGMEIVHRQLKDAFEEENIKEIEAEGQPFDPEFHQAVMQVENEDHESNTVVEVMQKGYLLNDRVIRPAMVKVTE
ncbi:MAG TPA: nucleotide exchange factor GrpE [Bacillales bacterium]|nr:nucleotide exchange factor GrpE [Bacillales bacterium]